MVYNINYAKNRKILEKCHDLKCYSIFVDLVRTEARNGATLGQAIAKTIHYCKENDILADYFAQKEQEEVFDMVNFKWDPELAMKVREEEAREEGMEKGILTSIRNLMKSLNLSAKQAMDALLIPPAEQEKYASQL